METAPAERACDASFGAGAAATANDDAEGAESLA